MFRTLKLMTFLLKMRLLNLVILYFLMSIISINLLKSIYRPVGKPHKSTNTSPKPKQNPDNSMTEEEQLLIGSSSFSDDYIMDKIISSSKPK